MKKIAHFLSKIWFDVTKEWRVMLLFLAPISLILFFLDFQNSNVGFLPLHSIDEDAFYGSLRGMYLGLIGHKFSALFGYGFYQYGFIYFFLNLLATLPAFIAKNTALVIVIPRLVTSFFAVGSLVVIYKISRFYLSELLSVLFCLFFATLPGFWFNATWFHPDWSMTFFLLLSVLYLVRDSWKFKKDFYLAVLFYSLAVAFKYQAVTVLPVLIIYVFYENIQSLNFHDIKNKIRLFLLSLSSVVGVFFLGNPYIAHPMGWVVFKSALFGNLNSNTTNNGTVRLVPIWDKLSLTVSDYYLNGLFLLVLLAVSIYLIYTLFKEKEKNVLSVIATNFLVNLFYLLIFVNKDWQIYYLPVFMIGLLVLLAVSSKINRKKLSVLFLIIISCQLVFYSRSYYSMVVTSSRDSRSLDFNDYSDSQNKEMNSFVLGQFKDKVSSGGAVLISPYTPFEYEKIGLSYEQVRVIYGPISEINIDKDAYVKSQRMFWGKIKTDEELARSFKKIDFIVLRKNIPFIDTKKINLLSSSAQKDYLKAVEVMKKLNDGSLGYSILIENELVVIYQNK